ncbi:MAG: hypothetical protein WCJ71_02960 [Candidatus Omnitrophota bacterium]
MKELLKKIPVVAVVLIVLTVFALCSFLVNRKKAITTLAPTAEAPIETPESTGPDLAPGMTSPVSAIPSDEEIIAIIADQAQKQESRATLVAARNEKADKVVTEVERKATVASPGGNPDDSIDSTELSPEAAEDRSKEFLALKDGVRTGQYFQR